MLPFSLYSVELGVIIIIIIIIIYIYVYVYIYITIITIMAIVSITTSAPRGCTRWGYMVLDEADRMLNMGFEHTP